jgi:hypothetical protein
MLHKHHVGFGPKADIRIAQAHVRFTPNSDRKSGFPRESTSALPQKTDFLQCKPFSGGDSFIFMKKVRCCVSYLTFESAARSIHYPNCHVFH